MIPPLSLGKGKEESWTDPKRIPPEMGKTVLVKRSERTSLNNVTIKHRYRIAYLTRDRGFICDIDGCRVQDVIGWKYIE